MNGLDWVLFVILVGAVLWGYRTGLVTAVLTVLALYIALVLSANFADRILGIFTDSVDNEALSKAIGYVVIFVGMLIGARVAAVALRSTIAMLFLGWVDKLGGIVVGVVAGILVSGAVIATLSNFVYVFDPSADSGSTMESAASSIMDSGPREVIDRWLTESDFTEALLSIRGIIPANTLGLAAGNVDTALDILEARVDEAGSSG